MKTTLIIYISVLLCLITSCKGKSENNNSSEITHTIDTINIDTIQKITTSKTSAPLVHVYMENSASMQGYNNKDCNGFTSVISELVSAYGRKNTKGYFYSDGLSEATDADKFADKIAGKKVLYGKSSPLHVIISTIINKNSSISFLVTDGIMSGTDEQIRTNASYNKDYREELQHNLSDKLKEKQLASSIYQFESNFDGTYYCYDNSQIVLKERKRPFYVIAIGQKKYINDFKNRIDEKSLPGLNPLQQIHFGLTNYPYNIALSASIFGKKDTPTTINIDISQIRKRGIEIDGKRYLDLSIHIPDFMPPHISEETYIRKNLIAKFNGTPITDKLILFNPDSRTIHMHIYQNDILKSNKLECYLKYKLPNWCMASSSNDDKGVAKSLLATTFNLEYLIKGIQYGIEGTKGEVWNIEYQIKKK